MKNKCCRVQRGVLILALIILPKLAEGQYADPVRHVQLSGIDADVPVYERSSLAAGQHITGPALITETVATTYLAQGWMVQVESHGNLLLNKQEN